MKFAIGRASLLRDLMLGRQSFRQVSGVAVGALSKGAGLYIVIDRMGGAASLTAVHGRR